MQPLTGRAAEEARKLRSQGMGVSQIAGILGVARNRAWRAVEPLQFYATSEWNRALQAGEVERGEACEECGSDKHIQGHHDDYARPLDVRWLCAACHTAVHAGDYGARPSAETVRAVWAVSMARQMSREELLGTESLESVVATYRRWTGWTGDTLAREDHHPTRTEAA